MRLNFFKTIHEVSDSEIGEIVRRFVTGLDRGFTDLGRGEIGEDARIGLTSAVEIWHEFLERVGLDTRDPVLGRVIPLMMNLGLRPKFDLEEARELTAKAAEAAPQKISESLRAQNVCRTYADVLEKLGITHDEFIELLSLGQYNGVISVDPMTHIGMATTRMLYDWVKLVGVFMRQGFVEAEAEEMVRALVVCAKDCPGCKDDSGCYAIALFHTYVDEDTGLPSPPSIT